MDITNGILTTCNSLIFIAYTWLLYFHHRKVKYMWLRLLVSSVFAFRFYGHAITELSEWLLRDTLPGKSLVMQEIQMLLMFMVLLTATAPWIVRLYAKLVATENYSLVLAGYSLFATITNLSRFMIRYGVWLEAVAMLVVLVCWIAFARSDFIELRASDSEKFPDMSYTNLTMYTVIYATSLFSTGCGIYFVYSKNDDMYLHIFFGIASLFILFVCVFFAKSTMRSIIHKMQEIRLRDERDIAAKKLANSQESVILSFAEVMEGKSGETGNHVKRVAEYSAILAETMKFAPQRVVSIRLASMMHDIGKMIVPMEILEKPGKLSPEEWKIMKKHVSYGRQILSTAQGDVMVDARVIAEFHHERYDGQGYMMGLKGEEIPIIAQIVAVADVYDALTSARSYKKAWTSEAAREEILNQRGKQFAPVVVDAFEASYERIHQVELEIAD